MILVDHSPDDTIRDSLVKDFSSPPVRLSNAISLTGLQGPCPFPCFLTMVLSTRRLPSLLRVPPSVVPRSHRYYEGATTSHWRIGGRLFGLLPPPTRSSCLLCPPCLG